jgi:hypothetical protein
LEGTEYVNTDTVSVERYGEMYLPICHSPEKHPFLSAFVFITFILLCGFILVSLTVAAVTSGINNRIGQIQAMTVTEEVNIAGILDNEESNEKFEDKFDPALVFLMLKQIWKQTDDTTKKIKNKMMKRKSLVHPLQSVQVEAARLKYQKARSLSRGRGMSWESMKGAFGFQRHSIYLRNTLGNVRYKVFFAFTVLMAAGLEILVLQEGKRTTTVEVAQAILQFYFSIDIGLKIVAHYPDYMNYFEEKWNRFDAAVVLLTWIPSISALVHSSFGKYFGVYVL